jgi:hypothetical protein
MFPFISFMVCSYRGAEKTGLQPAQSLNLADPDLEPTGNTFGFAFDSQ